MIVDVHTHTPRLREPATEDAPLNAMYRPDQAKSTRHSWPEYLRDMEAAGVARSIVFNIAADPREGEPDNGALIYPARQANDDTAAFVRAYPERLIGFLTVHPHDSGALDELERAHHDLGLRGVKFGPNYQNFDPLGPEACAIYDRAQALGLPVLFHQGTSPDRFADLDWAHPRHMDRVATRFPELKVIMAHMGHPWQIDCIVVIRKHPNVFADISALFYRPWSYYNAFRLATEWGVLPKLLFGSDYPIATPQETAAALFNVNDILEGTKLPRVPEDELDAILHRDSLGLLGLA